MLVVEDHTDLSTALKSFFRSFGYHVWFAADVASALRLAAKQPFDILLSDIGLPDGDGWALRRQLVQDGCCPPHTVAMSGFGMAEHAARSKAEGFARHLIKPFDPVALLEALNVELAVTTVLPHLSFTAGTRAKPRFTRSNVRPAPSMASVGPQQ